MLAVCCTIHPHTWMGTWCWSAVRACVSAAVRRSDRWTRRRRRCPAGYGSAGTRLRPARRTSARRRLSRRPPQPAVTDSSAWRPHPGCPTSPPIVNTNRHDEIPTAPSTNLHTHRQTTLAVFTQHYILDTCVCVCWCLTALLPQIRYIPYHGCMKYISSRVGGKHTVTAT